MKTNKSYKVLIGILVPIILLVLILFVRFKTTSKDRFSLARYVLVTIDGVNGRGVATLTLDDVGLSNAISDRTKSEVDATTFKKFTDSIKITSDRYDKLGNGDELLITVEYDENIAKQLGISIDMATRHHNVSGLKKGVALDAFADVQIVTEGISPFITVSYRNNSENEFLKDTKYEISKTSGNAIGDEIEITCKADYKKAADLGYYIDESVKKYTIDKADRYVSKAEEIDKDVISKISEECVQAVTDMTNDTTSHISYKITNNKTYLYRDGHEEAVNFEAYKVELADNMLTYDDKHQNYVLVYTHGQIRMPDYSGKEDPYEYIDSYFCFVYSDAIIDKEGKFIMETGNTISRALCSDSYDSLLSEVRYVIGPGFDFEDV